mmetsp:Transcript_39306/g.97097  ORF Transcript_39306/g.97097 Transcript_39306/m.97097 type:complete len:655 (+) Transcript_39306:337-2301(+)
MPILPGYATFGDVREMAWAAASSRRQRAAGEKAGHSEQRMQQISNMHSLPSPLPPSPLTLIIIPDKRLDPPASQWLVEALSAALGGTDPHAAIEEVNQPRASVWLPTSLDAAVRYAKLHRGALPCATQPPAILFLRNPHAAAVSTKTDPKPNQTATLKELLLKKTNSPREPFGGKKAGAAGKGGKRRGRRGPLSTLPMFAILGRKAGRCLAGAAGRSGGSGALTELHFGAIFRVKAGSSRSALGPFAVTGALELPPRTLKRRAVAEMRTLANALLNKPFDKKVRLNNAFDETAGGSFQSDGSVAADFQYLEAVRPTPWAPGTRAAAAAFQNSWGGQQPPTVVIWQPWGGRRLLALEGGTEGALLRAICARGLSPFVLRANAPGSTHLNSGGSYSSPDFSESTGLLATLSGWAGWGGGGDREDPGGARGGREPVELPTVKEQLRVLGSASVFIGAHSPGFSAALLFLPPSATVLEVTLRHGYCSPLGDPSPPSPRPSPCLPYAGGQSAALARILNLSWNFIDAVAISAKRSRVYVNSEEVADVLALLAGSPDREAVREVVQSRRFSNRAREKGRVREAIWVDGGSAATADGSGTARLKSGLRFWLQRRGRLPLRAVGGEQILLPWAVAESRFGAAEPGADPGGSVAVLTPERLFL